MSDSPLTGESAHGLRLTHITKTFRTPDRSHFTAVDNASFFVPRGEFFALLGPSGCGKTTLLRMIAGLETPDWGDIDIDSRAIKGVPAHLRPVNTVFQHYALFPHLTVAQNVAFGLRYTKVPREEWSARVARALSMVRLEGMESRSPAQLSGGQKQRVALARAIVLEPQVLLLDEPLAALDQKLRKEMQVELKGLQRKLGITFILVTHDQEEALTMSDRIAVMNQGRVEQIGGAVEVFERPATEFVAEFMGAGNFFSHAPGRAAGHSGIPPSAPPARFVVRPEKLLLSPRLPSDPSLHSMSVTIIERIYQGIVTQWLVRTDDRADLSVIEQNDHTSVNASLKTGDRAFVAWRPQDEVPLRSKSVPPPVTPMVNPSGRNPAP